MKEGPGFFIPSRYWPATCSRVLCEYVAVLFRSLEYILVSLDSTALPWEDAQ